LPSGETVKATIGAIADWALRSNSPMWTTVDDVEGTLRGTFISGTWFWAVVNEARGRDFAD